MFTAGVSIEGNELTNSNKTSQTQPKVVLLQGKHRQLLVGTKKYITMTTLIRNDVQIQYIYRKKNE